MCFSSRYSALRGLHASAVPLVLGGSGAGESDGALGKAPVCSPSPMEMNKVVLMGTGSTPYADVCQPTSRVSSHCAVLYNTWSTLSAASCIFNGGNLQRLRVCVRERDYTSSQSLLLPLCVTFELRQWVNNISVRWWLWGIKSSIRLWNCVTEIQGGRLWWWPGFATQFRPPAVRSLTVWCTSYTETLL